MTRLTKHTAQQQMTQNMLPMGDLYASVVDKLAQKQHFQTANTEPGGSGGARGRSSPILGSSSSSATSPDGSSLDYKVPPGSSSTSLTHPPPTSKGPAMMGSMTPEEHFERQQQQQSRRPRHQHFKTRARGSSGLPPRKVTYEELSHMDQESFLKALYDDPELAQAVAQEHAKEQQRSSGAKMKRSQAMKSQQRSEDSKQHRRAAGSGAVGTETEFLEELKKGGIPVVTWTVLIIMIAGALYKLYQWLAGPQAKGKPHHTNRGGGVTTLRKSKAKQPKAKQPHSQNTNQQQQQQLPVEEEKVVLELADAVGPSSIENSSTKKKKSTGKVAKKKPPNIKQQKSSSTSKQPQQTTPPEEVAPVAKEKINSGAVAPVTESWEETQAGDGEWQTVRKRADSTSKFPDKAEGDEHLSTPPPENGASLKPNGKKKKKKATGESSADIKQPSNSAGDNAGSALASDSGPTKQVVTADESKVVAADSEKPKHSAGKAEPASATTEKVGNGELVKGNTSSLQEDSVNKNKEDRQGVADDPLPVNGKESALLSPSDKPYQDVQNGVVNKDIAVGSSSATESKEENGGAKAEGGASSKASNANGAGDKKKKKSGKPQRKAASQPKTPPVPPVNPATTKNDALLALELQTQEEELAKQEAAAVAAAVAASSENPPAEKEDVWEEVTVRRKRVNRPTTENTTPSVAVTPAMTTTASAAAFDDDDDDDDDE
ncbi:hypothetical protein ACA910_003809 [Epithemia clementina (nom. ined.)]